MLARGGSITDEGGVVSVLQQVDLTADRGEAVAKLGVALGNGVYQSVHHRVEDDDRKGVTLVDTQLEVDGVGCPRLGGDDSCESIIDVGHQVDQLWGCMIVCQSKGDKVVVHTTERIGKVQPADTE